MKIKLLVLLLLVSGMSQAQTLKFGVKFGANYSDPSIQNEKVTSPLGYHFGGLVELKLAKFALQPELMYSGLNVKFNGNYVQSEVKVGYLILPVLVKVSVLKKFSIDLGPQFSYAVSKSTDTSLSGISLGDALEVNNFDYAVAGGVTANLTQHLFLQLRAVYGFEDITKKSSNPLINNPIVTEDVKNQINALVVKNRVVQLSVGYKF